MSFSSASAAPAAPGSFRPKCTCIFSRPGASHLPSRGTLRTSAGSCTEPAGPMALIRSPSISTTAFWMTEPSSTLITDAPVIAIGGPCGAPPCGKTAVGTGCASAGTSSIAATANAVRTPRNICIIASPPKEFSADDRGARIARHPVAQRARPQVGRVLLIDMDPEVIEQREHVAFRAHALLAQRQHERRRLRLA